MELKIEKDKTPQVYSEAQAKQNMGLGADADIFMAKKGNSVKLMY